MTTRPFFTTRPFLSCAATSLGVLLFASSAPAQQIGIGRATKQAISNQSFPNQAMSGQPTTNQVMSGQPMYRAPGMHQSPQYQSGHIQSMPNTISSHPSMAHSSHERFAPSGQGPVYRLQHDAGGREFICVGGQRIYFDNVSMVANQPGSADGYRAGYGSYDESQSQSSTQDNHDASTQDSDEVQQPRPDFDSNNGNVGDPRDESSSDLQRESDRQTPPGASDRQEASANLNDNASQRGEQTSSNEGAGNNENIGGFDAASDAGVNGESTDAGVNNESDR